jgi:three-Cys-motif partner protein
MVSLEDYAGREQSYVKHVFLERYLEALVIKTASTYNHIVYVDGFAGPWQSANEQFEDTSFGIALNALRRAKQTWQGSGRTVQMTALLVERDAKAFVQLAKIPARYPDIAVMTYPKDFMSVVPALLKEIPRDAFAFFLIDPKGWRIPLAQLQPLLGRDKSEVIFNFMFDFVNRAASMKAAAGLDELIPYGDWRRRLAEAEPIASVTATPEERKEILVDAFTDSLRVLGGYAYVVPTEILRPLTDRTLYCLFYATRHDTGLSVFRDCQIAALKAQSTTRAAGKVKYKASSSGQSELFESLHEMGPDEIEGRLEDEKRKAEAAIRHLVPKSPASIVYRKLWSTILLHHMVRKTDVNTICADMRKKQELLFPDWETLRRVPQDNYRVQRAE